MLLEFEEDFLLEDVPACGHQDQTYKDIEREHQQAGMIWWEVALTHCDAAVMKQK